MIPSWASTWAAAAIRAAFETQPRAESTPDLEPLPHVYTGGSVWTHIPTTAGPACGFGSYLRQLQHDGYPA